MLRILLSVLIVFGTICGAVVITPTPAYAATAYLAAKANGNLTSLNTWYLIWLASYLDSEANNTAIPTGGAWGRTANIAGAAVTCDGIGVKVALRAASPSGTISVRLYNVTGGAAVAGTTVTINATDIPSCVSATTNECGWVFFKWSSPVLLVAGVNYAVEVSQSSGTAQINLFRDATASNWSRYIRTTTSQAPVASDVMHIQREYTGAGTGTSWTVTMDSTATTDYGSGTDGTVAITIGNGCHLTYGVAGATNYYLKLSGNLIVYNGGYLDIGTVGAEIPRGSTAVLEFDPVADGGMGLTIKDKGYFNAQGLSRTSGKNIWKCKLNTDEAIAQTVLGVDTDTGWLDNDKIGIASTTRTYSQCEGSTTSLTAGGQLNGNAGANTLTVDGFGGAGGGVAYAHSGTSPTQAEVILLTRSINIRGTVSTLVAYVNCKSTSIVDIDWVEFCFLGENTAGKKSIEVETTTGSFSMQYSSIWSTEDWGFCTTGAATNNIVFSNNVMYNVATAVTNPVYVVATSGTTMTINNNVVMYAPLASSVGFNILDVGGAFTNNTVCGINGVGIQFGEANAIVGTFSGNISHSNASYGITLTNSNYNSTFATMTIWRNTGRGLYISSILRNCTISDLVAFGNTTANIYLLYGAKLIFSNPDCDGDSSFATTNGIETLAGTMATDIRITGGNFGVVSGIKVAHTNDINTTTPSYLQMYLFDTVLGSGVECVNYADNLIEGSFIKSDNNDNLGTTDMTWKRGGYETNEITIFKTAAPSLKQVPSSTTITLTGDSWYIPCDSGDLVTVTIYSRWDAAAAPATKPQVVLDGCGIATSTATNTALTTVWQQLTVSGTPTTKGLLTLTPKSLKAAGATSVYWDDISVTYAAGGSKNLGGLDYWFQALPVYFGKVITAGTNLIRSFGTIIGT